METVLMVFAVLGALSISLGLIALASLFIVIGILKGKEEKDNDTTINE